VVQKVWNPPAIVSAKLQSFLGQAAGVAEWSQDPLHTFIGEFISREGMKMGQLMNPLRLLMTGSNHGPGIMEIALLLGKDEFLKRIANGLKKLQS
jgi:glutamyl-tRNA synthetase